MKSQAIVSVIMGSKSDESHLEPAFKLLDEFGLPWETQVISAHRNPERLVEYVRDVDKRGVKIFIAAAGLSAALPGVVAAHTVKPVIGVPVPGGPLQGVDALLSIVQMPGGVPVATVGLGSNGPKNAAVLALEILALSDESLVGTIERHKEKLRSG